MKGYFICVLKASGRTARKKDHEVKVSVLLFFKDQSAEPVGCVTNIGSN